MKMYNLSTHGILTGCLTLVFLLITVYLTSSRIQEIEETAEMYKDWQEPPPPTLAMTITALIVSLIMIIVTGLLIVGILKKRNLFMAPWIILFLIALIAQLVFYIHKMMVYYRSSSLLYVTFIIGAEILIISPIIILYDNIRLENNDLKSKKESNESTAKRGD